MTSSAARIVLGSRGSDLARAQASEVERALRAAWPDLGIAIEIITTSGDERAGVSAEPSDRRAGRKGMFTREIERALLDRRIDVAVHSAKDLPSDSDPKLNVRAALKRADVEDLLITKAPGGLDSLGEGATVGTGSVRRVHQLRAAHPGILVVDLRGNVPTRLRKLIASDWSGIILARAGLQRLGIGSAAGEFTFDACRLFSEPLPEAQFLPAGGQGTIALQMRTEDRETGALLDAINDADSLWCLRAEREFLRLLDGDCDSPVGVLARLSPDGTATMRAQVFTTGESRAQTAEITRNQNTSTAHRLAAELMEKLHGG